MSNTPDTASAQLAFARNLFAAITARGINQSELARRANLERDEISRLVRGRKMPNLDELIAIGNALEISPNDLMISQSLH